MEVPPDLVLAIDQGTTNTKALLIDTETEHVVSSASRTVGISFPRPGWVEQDAEQLWAATVEAITTCLAASPVAPRGISIANQRETVVAWHRPTGTPLGPALGWQDARTAAWCAEREASAVLVADRTGLSLDPMYSAPKMRWLLDRAIADGVDPEEIALGTVDSWLVHKLTGEYRIETGNASRTLLLNLHSGEWDDELCALFGVPRRLLPQVTPSDAGFGRTRGSTLVPAGIPVAAVLADSHSALFFHGCTEPGAAKATYGTGSSVMTPVRGAVPAPAGITTTIAWQFGAQIFHAREGNILASGSALDWMAGILGCPAERSGGEHLNLLAAGVPDAGGVHFVPAFSGLGAPYWDRAATTVLSGATGGTGAGHLARAALDAVAHQVADVVEAVESDGAARISRLFADGGSTASTLLMQTQSDLLGRAVSVSIAREASALGAARLAARSLGLASTAPKDDTRPVVPEIDPNVRLARRAGWQEAVARARSRGPGRSSA